MWAREQVEVGADIEKLLDPGWIDSLGGDAFLERGAIEDPPKNPLEIGVVLELLLVRAHTDELHSLELDRLTVGWRYFQDHDLDAFDFQGLEREVNLRVEQTAQPVLQRFAADAAPGGN